jgi:hypothetical protein
LTEFHQKVFDTSVKSLDVGLLPVGYLPKGQRYFPSDEEGNLSRFEVQSVHDAIPENGLRLGMYKKPHSDSRWAVDTFIPALDTKISPIFEPGKVRFVGPQSVGLAVPLSVLKQEMLDKWKKTKYSTMKEECLDSFMSEAVNRVADYLDIDPDNSEVEDWRAASIDYKNATGYLPARTTIEALYGVKEHPLSGLALMSYGPSRAHFVVQEKDEVSGKNKVLLDEWCVKVSGQPMGGQLSFPLLCCINLAGFEYTVECYIKECVGISRRRRIENVKVIRSTLRINGDDLVMFCPKRFYDLFWSVGTFMAGFKKSLGKNYFTTSFATINSQFFVIDIQGRKALRCGYINQKLVFMRSLKTGQSSTPYTMIGREINKQLSLCEESIYTLSMTMKSFTEGITERVRRSSGKFYFRPNWFIPVELGGFGIDPKWVDGEFRITRAQRKAAAMFFLHPEISLENEVDTRDHLKELRFLNELKSARPRWVPKYDVLEAGTIAKAECKGAEFDTVVSSLINAYATSLYEAPPDGAAQEAKRYRTFCMQHQKARWFVSPMTREHILAFKDNYKLVRSRPMEVNSKPLILKRAVADRFGLQAFQAGDLGDLSLFYEITDSDHRVHCPERRKEFDEKREALTPHQVGHQWRAAYVNALQWQQ